MRTTRKDFVAQVQEHVLNAMDIVSFNNENRENIADTLQSVVDGFKSWYSGYEQKRTPNVQQAFKEYMLGLPSDFDIEYTYHNIHETLKAWFEACGAEYKERESDKEAELYYWLVTREFFKLCDKYGVSIY